MDFERCKTTFKFLADTGVGPLSPTPERAVLKVTPATNRNAASSIFMLLPVSSVFE